MPTTPSAADIFNSLGAIGGGGVLAFIVAALLRGWLVPGYLYVELRRQRDDLLNAVLNSTEAAKLALQSGQQHRSEEDRR